VSVAPDRNLALELVRVTEAAALASSSWVGRGEKESADQAAVDAMRLMLDTVEMNGVVVIGEGEKDEAPMLYNGEHVGNGHGPEVDVAVDPLEGTRLTALGMPNAIAVIAVAERGAMFDPGAAFYMDKIAVGPEAADAIDIDASPTENVHRVAEAKDMRPNEVHRRRARARPPRRADRRAPRGRRARQPDPRRRRGAEHRRAQAFTGVDMLMGIGGTPEGVISAAAIKCLGGALQGRLWPRNDEERQTLVDTGYDVDKVLGPRRPRRRRGRLRRRHGRHERGAPPRRPRQLRRGGDRVDRDALEVRDGAARRRLPSLREDQADQERSAGCASMSTRTS
jgi:fructose-1,6-bisphosphatase II